MVLELTDWPDYFTARRIVFVNGRRITLMQSTYRILVFLVEAQLCGDPGVRYDDIRIGCNFRGYIWRMRKQLGVGRSFARSNLRGLYCLRRDIKVKLQIAPFPVIDDADVEHSFQRLRKVA